MSKAPVDAVETSLEILERLESQAPSTVTELAESLNRPKGTIYYHLKTLEERGYVAQTEDGYELGLRPLGLGGRARYRHSVHDLVGPSLKRLATEANEMAFFAVEDRGSVVLLVVERPTGLTTDIEIAVGMRLPFHCSAAGKALLSELPDDRLENILENCNFTEYTSETIVEESVLREQIATVQSEGHAFDTGERDPSVHSVAAPVTDADGSVSGAIGIIGPASRLYSDRFAHELPHLVERFAERIENELRS